jgi:thioredoxin 1
MALEINQNNYSQLVESFNQLVVLDFWAQWCGPCRALTPIIEEVAQEFDGKVLIGKVDTDENSDLAMKFNVRNIPMLVFIKNNEIKDVHVGFIKKGDLTAKINALI